MLFPLTVKVTSQLMYEPCNPERDREGLEPSFYRIEFCLLAVGKTKNDLLVVLLDHLIINEKESEGLWWSTAIHVISDSGRRRS